MVEALRLSVLGTASPPGITVLVFLLLTSPLEAESPGSAATELVSRHLTTLGPALFMTSRSLTGNATFSTTGPNPVKSTASFSLSDGPDRLQVRFKFNGRMKALDGFSLTEYSQRFEPIQEGETPFFELLESAPALVESGLLFGSLTTRWSRVLASLDSDQMRYVGVTQIDGEELLETVVTLQSEMEARIYLDPTGFQHRRTRYKIPRGSPADSEKRLFLYVDEEFSDFESLKDVPIPRKWFLTAKYENQTSRWGLQLRKVQHQKLRETIPGIILQHQDALGSWDRLEPTSMRRGFGRVRIELPLTPQTLRGIAEFKTKGTEYQTFLELTPPLGGYAHDAFIATDSFIRFDTEGIFKTFLPAFQGPVFLRLLGGVLTTAWAFLDTDFIADKLDYGGLTQEPCHCVTLKYESQHLSSLLYFELPSLRHIATTHRLGLSFNTTYKKIEETFSDFRTFNGIELPRRWRIRSIDSSNPGETLFEFSFSTFTQETAR